MSALARCADPDCADLGLRVPADHEHHPYEVTEGHGPDCQGSCCVEPCCIAWVTSGHTDHVPGCSG